MVIFFAGIPEAVIFASSCSIDAFTASFAYGSRKIHIPFLSNQIINVICSTILGLSLLAGSAVRRFLPEWAAAALSFGVLFILGLVKLLDGVTKEIIRRHSVKNKARLLREIRFTLFNFSFILSLYADPASADLDENKVISAGEAAALALSLSLDGLALGFGAGVGSVSVPAAVIASLATDMLAVFLGCRAGKKAADKLPCNISWLAGVILLALAVSKLF